MKSSVKKLPKSQVEITVTVPYELYKKSEAQALEELGKEVKVDGFRPGHIPEAVIREKVSAETIRAVALENLLPKTYIEAVKQHDIAVIAPPKVDIKSPIKKEGDELVYVATVAVMPEVKVGDYKKLKIKRKKAKVEPKQVEETITMVLDRFAEWKEVDRKAKKGDRAETDFEGFDEKGEALPNTASKNHPIVLGSDTMVPGFEDAVIGMTPKENKEFHITFPKDYHSKPMQGKKVKFKLNLNRVEEKMEKALDEALIEKITGKKQTVEEFRKEVEADLLRENEYRANQEHDNEVVEAVIKITKVDLPDVLIEDEIKIMVDERKRQAAQNGLSWEQYLQHTKKTEEEFKKEQAKDAEKRLTARLGIQHIIREAKIEVSDEEADKRVEEVVARYPQAQQKQVREHYKKDGDAYKNLRGGMAVGKVIDFLSE